MNRRLPAEVITRQKRQVKKKTEEVKQIEEVTIELRAVLALKPDARIKWMSRALKMVEEGKASRTELFDIISSRKFASGVPARVCRKLKAETLESLDIFSDKQRRYLKTEEWPISAACKDRAEYTAEDGEEKGEREAEDVPAPPPPAPPPPAPLPAAPPERPPAPPPVAERPKSRALVPPAEVNDKGGWMVAADDSARQREKALEKAKASERDAKERAKKDANKLEEQERRMCEEAEEERRRALESEVDSSLMLLERLGQQRHQSPARTRSRDRRTRNRSRSRRSVSRKRKRARSGSSVSVQARSRSPSRSRRPLSKGDFNEALRRRMAEREKQVDSARIPVVDPGHAQRYIGRR